MAEPTDPDVPILQRDYAPGEVIQTSTVFQIQIQDPEDGRWMSWLTPDEDRDKITRIQVHRLLDPEHRGERRRVITRRVIDFVDEIEGDGEGETSAEELIARNEENTRRLLGEEQTGD